MSIALLQPMQHGDVEAVLALETAVHAAPWSRRVFLDELGADGRDYVVAKLDDEVVGYGGCFTVLDEAHVATLGVGPQWRRRGLARSLVAWLVRAALRRGAVSMTLEVRASNGAAQGLYRSFGFAPVGVRPGYYAVPSPAEDALIMWVHDLGGADMAARLARADEAPRIDPASGGTDG